MAELPPVSDPQIAKILEQESAKKKRVLLIIVGVVVLLGATLGGSQVYFSAQAKKKRDLAYSHVIKCLLGAPPAPGEPVMPKVRAAWRARTFVSVSDKLPASLDEKESDATKLWPNRCVAEMVAFTDTLKENGDMKEGDKDLGFYSRELSKQTAGDNWKNVDTYQAALEAFLTEADKDKCAFVDVPDVQAPETLDARPLDELLTKTSTLPLPLGPTHDEVVRSGTRRFYLPSSKGRPAQLCTTKDGKALTCAEPIKGGVPVEASGTPYDFGAEQDALPLLSFASGTAVYRADGLSLIKPGEYFAAGGYSYADGRALLLLTTADGSTGEAFKIGRLAPGSKALTFEDVKLTGWDGAISDVGLFGSWAVWVNLKNELLAFDASKTPVGPVQVVGAMPGVPGRMDGGEPMHLCRTKIGSVLYTPISIPGDLPKTLFVFVDTSGTLGKLQILPIGSVECGDEALYVWSDFLATCHADGCANQPLERPKRSPSAERVDLSTVIEGAFVTVEADSGLVRVTWQKAGKTVATKVFDAQLKGTVLLAESKVKLFQFIDSVGYAMLVLGTGAEQHVVRLDAAGSIEPVAVN